MQPDDFRAPAQPMIQIWRVLLGIVIIGVIFIAAQFGAMLLGARLLNVPPATLGNPPSPLATAFLFASFLGMHLGLFLVLRLLHKRPYRSLFGPALRVNRRHLLLGIGATLLIALLLGLTQTFDGRFFAESQRAIVEQSLDARVWLTWLIPALLFILMQTSAEELVFRGYLLQQLSARFRSPILWLFLPSLLFGMMHFAPGEYGLTNALLYVGSATVSGLIASLVTRRTGNLGAAIGLHFGNNASLVFMGTPGPLSGFSLMVARVPLSGPYMTYSILVQVTVTLLVFWVWWRWMDRRQPIANAVRAD